MHSGQEKLGWGHEKYIAWLEWGAMGSGGARKGGGIGVRGTGICTVIVESIDIYSSSSVSNSRVGELGSKSSPLGGSLARGTVTSLKVLV